MAGTAQATQHHWKLWFGRQRTILAEVGPVRPLLLGQQQDAPLVIVGELHLLAKQAEYLELAARQAVSFIPGHALKHRGTSFSCGSADTRSFEGGKGGNWRR